MVYSGGSGMSTAKLNRPPSPPSECDLPEGWTVVQANDVCDINPHKPDIDALPADTLVTFVPMAAVDESSGRITSPENRPFGELRSKSYTPFAEGDVLFAKITPCMENGKAALARGLTNKLGFGSTEFHAFRSLGAILPEYLYHYIRQQSFRGDAQAHMTGTAGQLRVPAEYVKDFQLPLPPLAEQKRIVAKVEALLERVNAARARQDRVRAILKRFRQSVLAAACSGELTAEWRSDGGNLDGDMPQDWQSKTVVDVCSAAVDCPHSTPKWTETGEICLRTTNFRPGRIDLSEVRFVSRETYATRIARVEPKPDDVLYSREGGILGIACIFPRGLHACLGQRMMILRPSAQILPAYLMHWLNSPSTLFVVRELTGGTASPHINVGDVKAFPIWLPPLDEQREIVRRVETLFALADRIEANVRAAIARAERLPQAILARAFRGELVPTEAELAAKEGRDYEPASALLERIRRAREKQEAPNRERKGRKMARGSGRPPAATSRREG